MADLIPFTDLERMAQAIASSNLFGLKTKEQALGLMLLCQAEGLHPAIAARDYHIVQGRPAKKAEVMLRDFLGAGGKVEWKESSDKAAEAIFSHPQGGTLTLRWDEAKARQANLWGKGNWQTYPAAMLRARLISEGVRAIFPAATSGMYVPEEVESFEPPRNITPLKKIEDSEAVPPTAMIVTKEALNADEERERETLAMKSELKNVIHSMVREHEVRGDLKTSSEVLQELLETEKAKFDDIDKASKPSSIERLRWALAKGKALLGQAEKENAK